jgi:hypothetical protein
MRRLTTRGAVRWWLHIAAMVLAGMAMYAIGLGGLLWLLRDVDSWVRLVPMMGMALACNWAWSRFLVRPWIGLLKYGRWGA